MRKFQVSSLRNMNLLGGLMLALTGLTTGCPAEGDGDCPSGKVRAADKSCVSAGPCTKKNELAAADGSCVCETGFERVAADCLTKCQTHATRSASGSCACDEGYVASGSDCVSLQSPPDMASTPPDMSDPPSSGVDLYLADFVMHKKSDGLNYTVYLDGKSDFIKVRNRGLKDAPGYYLGFGVYNVDDGKAIGCSESISGTKAGQEIVFNKETSCSIPLKMLKTGMYRLVAQADTMATTGDTNPNNNRGYSASFLITGGALRAAAPDQDQLSLSSGPPVRQLDNESAALPYTSAHP